MNFLKWIGEVGLRLTIAIIFTWILFYLFHDFPFETIVVFIFLYGYSQKYKEIELRNNFKKIGDAIGVDFKDFFDKNNSLEERYNKLEEKIEKIEEKLDEINYELIEINPPYEELN